MTAPQLSPEILAALEREQQTIRLANAEIASLQHGGISVKARETVQGIELEIERPTWRKGYVSRSWRLIPWA
jgi:hypothetical protein